MWAVGLVAGLECYPVDPVVYFYVIALDQHPGAHPDVGVGFQWFEPEVTVLGFVGSGFPIVEAAYGEVGAVFGQRGLFDGVDHIVLI